MGDLFTEVEYKYKADSVGLADFTRLMDRVGYDRSLDVSSWDTYFTHVVRPEEFLRYRAGSTQELTIKRKTTDSNNWDRTEVDLPLDPKRIDTRTVCTFAELLGYSENFKIYKTCFIYYAYPYTYVYYIVYNDKMQEAGRFIEVELDKGAVSDWKAAGQDTFVYLNRGETLLNNLGITYRNRLKKSVFELFRV